MREASQACYDLHMNGVFTVSPAEVVIVLGKVAREALLGAGADLPQSPLQMDLGGKTRAVFFLPHPNERGSEKSLAAHYGSEALNEARKLVEMPG